MSEQYSFAGRNASEIAADAERAIREHRLRPGDRLPPVRGLARDLGVSPATVAAAYSRLARRGLTRAEGRRGTRVAPAPPVATVRPPGIPAGARDLASGYPDPALLPALGPMLRSVGDGPAVPEPGRTMDVPDLVALARERFRHEGIEACGVAVVAGALDGIERVLRAQLRPGDRVAVEDPGFRPLFDLLPALGLEARPVAMDDRGLLPDRLAPVLAEGVDAVVLTPRAQNPTGAALDADRATHLRELLRAHPDVLVVEDDHAGPVAGSPAVTVTDPAQPRWAVVRSVSKWLGPDLRIALLTADATTLARVQGLQGLGTGWVSQLLQRAVYRLWLDPATEQLLHMASAAYRERRDALVAALAAHGVGASAPSGLNVWVPVTDEAEVTAGLRADGWVVAPGQRFRIASGPAVRVTAARLDPSEAGRVASVIARYRAGRGVPGY